jgi:hypothetical protein
MTPQRIKDILEAVLRKKISIHEGMERLAGIYVDDLGFAKLDHHRALRTGVPEVILATGKTERQIIAIFDRMVTAGSDVMVTRAERGIYRKLKRKHKGVRYNEIARVIYLTKGRKNARKSGVVAVVSAGTADMNVAEEASAAIEAFGGRVERIYDVGVAGIHRLLLHQEKLRQAKVVIVVAGMEGALASVVGGLVAAPVIAVPTSVGYGASFDGLAALLAMLNSCAPGVTVVNIDNGFGAAMAAIKMMKK